VGSLYAHRIENEYYVQESILVIDRMLNISILLNIIDFKRLQWIYYNTLYCTYYCYARFCVYASAIILEAKIKYFLLSIVTMKTAVFLPRKTYRGSQRLSVLARRFRCRGELSVCARSDSVEHRAQDNIFSY